MELDQKHPKYGLYQDFWCRIWNANWKIPYWTPFQILPILSGIWMEHSKIRNKFMVFKMLLASSIWFFTVNCLLGGLKSTLFKGQKCEIHWGLKNRTHGVPFWTKWQPFCPKPRKVRTKWLPSCSDCQLFGFGMVGTIAIAIAMTKHSKIELSEIQTSKHLVFQCARCSNVQY